MRFYVGNVKLSIADRQTIRHHQSWPTDEGYEYNATEYTLEGNKLFATVHHGGQDCDGRTGGCAELMATVAFPCAIPNWEYVERSVRLNAELDNY